MRRFTALGLAAFMLHLNVVRADVACAAHGTSSAQDVPTQHDMAGMHGGDDSRSDSGAEQADCETPAQRDCCQAVTSCSPVLGFGVETVIAERIPTHDSAGTRYTTHPLSRSTAPEPPPPRL